MDVERHEHQDNRKPIKYVPQVISVETSGLPEERIVRITTNSTVVLEAFLPRDLSRDQPYNSLLLSQILLLLGTQEFQVLELHLELFESLHHELLVSPHIRPHLTALIKQLEERRGVKAGDVATISGIET